MSNVPPAHTLSAIENPPRRGAPGIESAPAQPPFAESSPGDVQLG
jgi:hypothetical protein